MDEKCQWTENSDGYFETECDNAFCFSDVADSDEGTGFKFCPYCGKEIRWNRIEVEEDEEEIQI